MKNLLVLLTGILILASCTTQQEVNIYTARHYDTDNELYETFTEQTGIEVNVIEGGSDELIERIKSEGDNSPADVFITVDAGRMWRAQEAGILSPFESTLIEERIDASLIEPGNHWVSLTRRVRGIVYNTETVSHEDLSTYEDLADPKWEGRVCVRSSNNIYNQSLLASIIESQGEESAEEWSQGLMNNFARDPQGGDTDQIRAVAAGVCDVAIVNHYYYVRLLASDDTEDSEVTEKTAFFFPNQDGRGAHVNVSAAGVVSSAPNQANAVRFIEFLTGVEAQQVLAAGNYEFPANTSVEPQDILDQFGEFKSDAVNVSAYGENNPTAIRIMDRAGWK